MLKNILNLDGVTRLSSKEQSVIKGSGCAIAIRNADGSFGYWSEASYSVSDAQAAYNNGTEYNDGSYASGYCCASCPASLSAGLQ